MTAPPRTWHGRVPMHPLAALLVLLLAATARGGVTPAVSPGELACQTRVARALSRQAANHARCVARCERLAARTGGPTTACVPPGYGGATLACIEAGEARSRAAMVARCPEDGPRDTCPEVYEQRGGSCAGMAAQRVATDHGQFGLFTSSVVCEHQDFPRGGELARQRYRCQAAVASALVRHFGAVNAVYARCNAAIARGEAPVGACAFGATLSPRSPGNVMPALGARTAASIDARCFTPPAVAPTCYDGSVLRPRSGAAWVALVNLIAESAADGNTFVAE